MSEEDLVKRLVERILRTSWEAFGGKLDGTIIAYGIQEAARFDNIRLILQHPPPQKGVKSSNGQTSIPLRRRASGLHL